MVLLALTLLACAGDRFSVELHVVDEGGTPVAGATVRTPDGTVTTDADGHARLKRLDRPLMVLVEADGALTEPVPVGRWDTAEPVQVRLLDAEGRVVVHSTGDLMLGRRYVDPTEGEALVDPADGDSARAVVDDIAPALALADLVTVNLETVVAALPDADAYPGKRWLLQTPPAALSALDHLGVDMAGLANNHARDWLDEGVGETLDHLDAAGVPWLGAGLVEEEAGEARIVEVGGLRIGVLAFTSVDGDYVNDQYPLGHEDPPVGLDEEEAFAWETRLWGLPELGIPETEKRIGDAWAHIEALDGALTAEQEALLWASASEVFPELQDWVARRGHGGANGWTAASPDEIAALAEQTDLVIVQLHMGFQFAAAPSAALRGVAEDAVAAGADLVVGHHPHVLQGVEWIDGVPVAWSLGNFAFDQDFLSTFESVFLRTVWEGDTLVEARLVPVFLDRYRPVPVADGRARRALRTVWERSALQATAARGSDLGVRALPDDGTGEIPGFVLEHSTARLTRDGPRPTSVQVELDGGIGLLDGDALYRPADGAGDDLLLGRALSGLGDFEDQDGDRDVGEVAGWTWTSDDVLVRTRGPLEGAQTLSLVRNLGNGDRVSARMIARVPMPEHRLWADAEGDEPLDGEATWSVRLRAERVGPKAPASVRLALYHFDDLDPTEDPESVLLREVELSFDSRKQATDHLLDLPADALDPVDGLRPNAALVYLSLYPPERGTSHLDVDQVELVEWRPASDAGERWAAWDYVRSSDAPDSTVTLLAWPGS